MEKSRVKKYAKYREEILAMKDYTEPSNEEVIVTKEDFRKAKEQNISTTTKSLTVEEIVTAYENYLDPKGEKRENELREKKKKRKEALIIGLVTGFIILLVILGLILTFGRSLLWN